MSFEGKQVIVTGGARGIGRAIAEQFLSEGANLSLIDLEPVKDFNNSRGSVHSLVGSVSSSVDVQKFIGEIMSRTGRIDVLVNNAGIIRDNIIWRMSEEEFDSVIDTNLKGAWLLCRAVAPIMKEQKSGRIVNIVSRAWLGNVGQSNYSASKGGLVSLTRVLALELATHNVTVNAVAPGLIDTPMTQNLSQQALDKLIAAQPGNKMGKPEDIARAVAFLSADENSFISGQVLHVDGGKSIGATVF
jgi:NAD(P)-dependent dehydrogenase (short-subunit alcohol dehydrogenase family)